MPMKRLISKLLALLAVMTVVVSFSEWQARKIPTSYSIKDKNLLARADHIEELVLGSSHSNFGIDPHWMGDNVYNISNVSQDLYYDRAVLKKYLPLCPRLKVVVLPISYFTLYYKLAESSESWRTDYYAVILGIPKDGGESSYYRRYSYLALMDGPINALTELKHGRKLEISSFGFQKSTSPKDVGKVINDEKGKARVDLHQGKLMHAKNLAGNMEILDTIAKLCREKGIKLVIVTTPVYKTYYDHISPAWYGNMLANIGSVSRKYNASYLNYFYDKRFELDDYMDNDHLNENGARKFSFILKDDICKAGSH